MGPSSSDKTTRVAVIPGDGIGIEVTAEAVGRDEALIEASEALFEAGLVTKRDVFSAEMNYKLFCRPRGSTPSSAIQLPFICNPRLPTWDTLKAISPSPNRLPSAC